MKNVKVYYSQPECEVLFMEMQESVLTVSGMQTETNDGEISGSINGFIDNDDTPSFN